MASTAVTADLTLFLKAFEIRKAKSAGSPAAQRSAETDEAEEDEGSFAEFMGVNYSAEKAKSKAYAAQLLKEAEISSAFIMNQENHSMASKVRARAAHALHQQRSKAMKSEIFAHQTAIDALGAQLSMTKAEHAATHLLFDMQDAVDLQIEDERRCLPAAAAAARLERERQRAAHAATAAALHAEITRRTAQIDAARARFETALRQDCVRNARIALRELRLLRQRGASAARGEKRTAFWNAVRRALTKAEPAACDLEVYEAYRRELALPVLDGGSGMPPGPEVLAEYGSEFMRERDGLFSITAFQSVSYM